MKLALRLGPVAAACAALAVLLGLISASGAGNNADAFAIDLDTAGNTSTTVGTIEECREVAAGSSVTFDVVAQNVPAATAMISYAFAVLYDESQISVTGRDLAGLLSTAAGYSEFDASDAIPDTDGSYIATTVDITAAGVSGTGYLQRLTIDIAPGAPAGGYALTLDPAQTSHVDQQNNSHGPDEVLGARLAVGVTCDSLPSPTAAPANAQGDVDCSDVVNSVDALKVLRFVAGLSVAQTEPCDDVNTGGPPLQGDVDCSGVVNSVDSLKILRYVAGLSVAQTEPCADIGT